jgi:hypothetical protein
MGSSSGLATKYCAQFFNLQPENCMHFLIEPGIVLDDLNLQLKRHGL